MIPRITIESHRDTHIILDALDALENSRHFAYFSDDVQSAFQSLRESVLHVHSNHVAQDMAKELTDTLKHLGVNATVIGEVASDFAGIGEVASAHAVHVDEHGHIHVKDVYDYLG